MVFCKVNAFYFYVGLTNLYSIERTNKPSYVNVILINSYVKLSTYSGL